MIAKGCSCCHLYFDVTPKGISSFHLIIGGLEAVLESAERGFKWSGMLSTLLSLGYK